MPRKKSKYYCWSCGKDIESGKEIKGESGETFCSKECEEVWEK